MNTKSTDFEFSKLLRLKTILRSYQRPCQKC